jgi:hypothetical protein
MIKREFFLFSSNFSDHPVSCYKIKGCREAFCCVLHEVCIISKVTTSRLESSMELLHDGFRKRLTQMERETWTDVTQVNLASSSSSPFSMCQRKLLFLHMFYSSLKLPGCKEIADAFDRVNAKHAWIRRRMKEGTYEKITKRQWQELKPRLRQLPRHRLFSLMKTVLRKVDMSPTNASEERDFLLVHLILERYIPHHSPHTLLLLLDGADTQMIGGFIDSIKDVKSPSCVKAEVGKLTPRYKKALKLILLLYARHNDFNVTYADNNPLRLKCLACLPKDYEKESTFIVCEYCREILTYRDMHKRPSSKGFYFQTEKMEMRCYRDDSDKLKCITCFMPNPYVSLLLSHPDRNDVGLCDGKRSCFRSVGFSDRLCGSCAAGLESWQIHEDTCLGMKREKPCKTCEIVLKSMGGSIPQQPVVDETCVVQSEKDKLLHRKQPALIRMMEYAKAARERRKLIK